MTTNGSFNKGPQGSGWHFSHWIFFSLKSKMKEIKLMENE